MAQVNAGLSLATPTTASYSMDQILQATQPQKQPGKFRQFLGAVVGGVGNMFAPGIGGLIGSAISGGGLLGGVGQTGLINDSMQYLQLQKQLAADQEAFETASAVVKSRHDAAMAAIRNIN
jgi:hypothetical protein